MGATTPMLKKLFDDNNIYNKDGLKWYLDNNQGIFRELNSIDNVRKIECRYSGQDFHIDSEELVIYHSIFFGQIEISNVQKISFYNCLFRPTLKSPDFHSIHFEHQKAQKGAKTFD